jgi:hypothetical protein
MSRGFNFADPINPGFYPATLATNAQQELEPKQRQSIKSSSTSAILSKEFI